MEFDYKSLLKKKGVNKSVAPLNKRIMAFVVDILVFFFLILMPFNLVFFDAANVPGDVPVVEEISFETLFDYKPFESPEILEISNVAILVSILIFLCYLSLCEALLGYTFGKKIFGLMVVDKDYKPIGVYQALLRNLTKTILFDLLLFDIILMVFDKRHRRISDFVLGTLVVTNHDKDIITYDLSNIV